MAYVFIEVMFLDAFDTVIPSLRPSVESKQCQLIRKVKDQSVLILDSMLALALVLLVASSISESAPISYPRFMQVG